MQSIDIITANKYPNGDAGSIRQHVMAKMLTEMGYSVFVHGMGATTNWRSEINDGIKYKSYRGISGSIVNRILDRFRFVDRVLRTLRTQKTDYLLVIDVSPVGFWKIERFAKNRNIVLIHDSVEWYSPEEFKAGRFSLQYMLKKYTNTVAINKNWNVIAISDYLRSHFSNRVNNVAYIPVIMDIHNAHTEILPKNDRAVIRFVYAGAPGMKDLLREIIKGFALLTDELLEHVELHIIGVTEEQMLNDCFIDRSDIALLGKRILVHGRLPHEEAVDFVKNADYTLMLRDETLTYAKAGFPTKIVESLMYGIPPICNISSDLGRYLVEKENAIIVYGHDAKAFHNALVRALSCSSDDYFNMRKNARQTAIDNFDYRIYKSEMKKVFQQRKGSDE